MFYIAFYSFLLNYDGLLIIRFENVEIDCLFLFWEIRRATGPRRVRSPAPVPVPGSWSSGPLDSSSGVQKDTRMVSLGEVSGLRVRRVKLRNHLFKPFKNQSLNRSRFLWIVGAKTDPKSTYKSLKIHSQSHPETIPQKTTQNMQNQTQPNP